MINDGKSMVLGLPCLLPSTPGGTLSERGFPLSPEWASESFLNSVPGYHSQLFGSWNVRRTLPPWARCSFKSPSILTSIKLYCSLQSVCYLIHIYKSSHHVKRAHLGGPLFNWDTLLQIPHLCLICSPPLIPHSLSPSWVLVSESLRVGLRTDCSILFAIVV